MTEAAKFPPDRTALFTTRTVVAIAPLKLLPQRRDPPCVRFSSFQLLHVGGLDLEQRGHRLIGGERREADAVAARGGRLLLRHGGIVPKKKSGRIETARSSHQRRRYNPAAVGSPAAGGNRTRKGRTRFWRPRPGGVQVHRVYLFRHSRNRRRGGVRPPRRRYLGCVCVAIFQTIEQATLIFEAGPRRARPEGRKLPAVSPAGLGPSLENLVPAPNPVRVRRLRSVIALRAANIIAHLGILLRPRWQKDEGVVRSAGVTIPLRPAASAL